MLIKFSLSLKKPDEIKKRGETKMVRWKSCFGLLIEKSFKSRIIASFLKEMCMMRSWQWNWNSPTLKTLSRPLLFFLILGRLLHCTIIQHFYFITYYRVPNGGGSAIKNPMFHRAFFGIRRAQSGPTRCVITTIGAPLFPHSLYPSS